MGTRDKRIDAYIAKSGEFARPILTHIRETIHSVSPDIDETVKWGHPTFAYHGILCGMAAFKEHCTLGYWKGKLIYDTNGKTAEEAMGHFGRITRVSELPPKKMLVAFTKEAMRLNAEGVKVVRTVKPKPRLVVPAYFKAALAKNRKAAAAWESLPPGHRREYLQWITEAKQEATRGRRIAQAVEWIADGKGRNWKYEKR